MNLFTASPALEFFLENNLPQKKGLAASVIASYLEIDDNDVLLSIKYWQKSRDKILADLCHRFLNPPPAVFSATTFSKKPATPAARHELTEKPGKS